MYVRFIQMLRLFAKTADSRVNACAAETSHSPPLDLRIGIKHGDHNMTQPGLNQNRYAGRSSFVEMAAGLKCDVECPASSLCAGRIEGKNFGMRLAGSVMITLADDAAFRDDDCSDHRIRARTATSPRGKAERSSHVEPIKIGGIHRVRRDADFPPAARRACGAFTDRVGILAFPFLLT